MTYPELTAAIAAQIKTNGQNAIKGSTLQGVLLKMVVAGINLPEENFGQDGPEAFDIDDTFTRDQFLALLGIDGDTLDHLLEGGIPYIDSAYTQEERTVSYRYFLTRSIEATAGEYRVLQYNRSDGSWFEISRDSSGYHIGKDSPK